MPVPADRLQQIIEAKDTDESGRWVDEHDYVESWAIIDGALVIHDHDDPPAWLPTDSERDEDGDTKVPHAYVRFSQDPDGDLNILVTFNPKAQLSEERDHENPITHHAAVAALEGVRTYLGGEVKETIVDDKAV